jgi:hypothetical protein
MRDRFTVALATALSLVSLSTVAIAQQTTGLEDLHEKRREGNRICMTDHFHDGYGQASKRGGAEAAAILHWRQFTAGEYGLAWGSYLAAASKSMKCTQSDSGWSCHVTARPCRKG